MIKLLPLPGQAEAGQRRGKVVDYCLQSNRGLFPTVVKDMILALAHKHGAVFESISHRRLTLTSEEVSSDVPVTPGLSIFSLGLKELHDMLGVEKMVHLQLLTYPARSLRSRLTECGQNVLRVSDDDLKVFASNFILQSLFKRKFKVIDKFGLRAVSLYHGRITFTLSKKGFHLTAADFSIITKVAGEWTLGLLT